MYAEMLKKIFNCIDLQVEDLLLLDTFQIKTLPAYAPEKELALVLHEYKYIEYFFITKNPDIQSFISDILNKYKPTMNKEELEKAIDNLVWELALSIVSNKYPEVCDSNAAILWSNEEIINITPLENKIIVDVGAGSGKLAFQLAKLAKTIYAIEPVTNLRKFMRKKAIEKNVSNFHVCDGFIHSIPLANNSVDILITSNAIGWDFDKELPEIERVVRSGGYAIHLMQSPRGDQLKLCYKKLTSSDWNYKFQESDIDNNNVKIKFWKRI